MVPERCPRCGCATAESHERPRGRVTVLYDLETGNANYEIMWDGLTSEGKWLYCNECGKRLCTVEEFEGQRKTKGRAG